MKPLITLLLTFCILTSPFTIHSSYAAPAPVPQTGQTTLGNRIKTILVVCTVLCYSGHVALHEHC
jgi:hypothetical protein